MMRVVWWSTALLVLLAAASALRTPQVEGLTRTSRRLPSPSAPDVNSVSNFNQPEAQPTFRSRNSRGRDETTPRDVVRTRTRNRPIEATSESAQSQENNERFDSRRTSSRSRSRPVEIEVKAEPIVARENVARGRFRQVSRRPPQVTQTTLETSSPTIDESKLEVINSNLDDISKIVPREEITSTTQFRRRSSATPTTEAIVPRGRRGRINTRTNTRPLDLDSSGTTNSISVSDKEPTTARTGDIRNARKLRFRTRPAESDANLTGEGLTKRNEAVKSSQRKEITSQSEAQTFAPIVERIVSQSTEANKLKTTTLKVTKVIRRPLSRRKPSIRSSGSPPKTKETEEISDDDNYPPSFKALIQSKNASGGQEPTTQRSKLTATGQTSDEALQKLIQQTKITGMVSEATKAPISLSTEYGNSNDALLAALLKEQGFGPTTASSLDEQLRLAALLNQVVVTPKSRRPTTTLPPPPAPRRPILDGLAWLWQQWRETGPESGAPRPDRRPVPSARPSPSSASALQPSSRPNWFGSGPFVGNADERPTNRIPLEPPRAVGTGQAPGRGQLVSAAINVTRAFSQFLGAAIQGAAQTVQNVIRAGTKVASDVYTNGSGGSG